MRFIFTYSVCYQLREEQDEGYLLVEQAVDDEEEGALLGVENYKQDLEEEVGLVQAENPGAAQYDKLGNNFEQNQSVKNEKIRVFISVHTCYNTSAIFRLIWISPASYLVSLD